MGQELIINLHLGFWINPQNLVFDDLRLVSAYCVCKASDLTIGVGWLVGIKLNQNKAANSGAGKHDGYSSTDPATAHNQDAGLSDPLLFSSGEYTVIPVKKLIVRHCAITTLSDFFLLDSLMVDHP
jgi:hypothetical protein